MMKFSIGIAALALAAAQPAAAQEKHSKQPFDVHADQIETHNTDCTAVGTGSAEALQDTSRLRADVMIAHMEIVKGKVGGAGPSNECGPMTTLEAKGSVYYVASDGRRVHGDNGFYDASTNTITITGDVTAVKGQDVIRGTKMVYNTQTGEGHVEGSGKGAGAKNRPRAVFYPKDADADPSASDKPKKAAK